MLYTFEELPWLSDVLNEVIEIDCLGYTRQWNAGSNHQPDGFFTAPENVFVLESIREHLDQADIGGIDVPVLIRSKEDRRRVALVGIDPLRKPSDFTLQMDAGERFFIGTPYAVHCDRYAKRTSGYRQVIGSLIQKGISIYLTDICKVYLSNISILSTAQEVCIKILEKELSYIQPTLTVCMGRIGENIHNSRQHLQNHETMWLPHLASSCWHTALKLMDKHERAATRKGVADEFTERVMARLDQLSE